MTNKQAIQLLHRLSDEQFDGIHGDERWEALEMAVRALSGDGDMVYRQQAIDAVVSAIIDGADAELVEGVMEQLPPAQPQWIPSSEGKPKRDGKYIVTTPRWKIVDVKEYSVKYLWEGGTPLAWMPLPKPYGGESE